MSPLWAVVLVALAFVAFAWLGRRLDSGEEAGGDGCALPDDCLGCRSPCSEPEVKHASPR